MTIVVQKFGGTSVATVERIQAVAMRVKAEVEAGNRVAVVVSAMAGVTSQLASWAHEITPFCDGAEYDAVISSGELVTSGLLAIALQKVGIPARSWAAWQIPISATGVHGHGIVESIDQRNLLRHDLIRGSVAVVAGFQAVNSAARLITLGRGGSDTSAVELAHALGAGRCDIYTDVEGIYTADPRRVRGARKLDRISYMEMLEMASLGAKVLHVDAVAAAMRYGVNLRVLSSFKDMPGTMVVSGENMENNNAITGITLSENEVFMRVQGTLRLSQLIVFISKMGVSVDVVSATQVDHEQRVEFLLPQGDFQRVHYELVRAQDALGIRQHQVWNTFAKISLIGRGLRSQPLLLATILETVEEICQHIIGFMVTENRISFVIPRDIGEAVLTRLHQQVGLDQE